MRLGEVLRYGYPKDSTIPFVDDLPSFWFATRSPDVALAQLERGINPIARTGPDGRIPAVLIGSSPHKAGTRTTPWDDEFDVDSGRVRYYGDSKPGDLSAPNSTGNRVLREVFAMHSSPDRAVRVLAPPLVLFRRVSHNGRKKGFVEFQGIGIIERLEHVRQVDTETGRPFENMVAEIVVLDMAAEGDEFDWAWITARRNPNAAASACLASAPAMWRRWVDEGTAALPAVRRNVAPLPLVGTADQIPVPGTREADALDTVLRFYRLREARFAGLAEEVAARVIAPGPRTGYRMGWVVQQSDVPPAFVGRLDIGTGFARTSLGVLGSARFESPPTESDISDAVARLDRNWIGCWVTTTPYSGGVQSLVRRTSAPLLLVHGRRLAEELIATQQERGVLMNDLLEELDGRFESRLRRSRPEAILMAV